MRMRMVGHVAGMGEKRNAYSLLVGGTEGKRRLERPRHRWMDNVRMDLGEVGGDNVYWIGLAKDRNRWSTILDTVMKLLVLRDISNVLYSCTTVGFSRRSQVRELS
jgi:hypothetical protein